jgi:surface antigen
MIRKRRVKMKSNAILWISFVLVLLVLTNTGCLQKNERDENKADPPIEKTPDETIDEQPHNPDDFNKAVVTIGGIDKEYYYDSGTELTPVNYDYYWCTYYAAREFHKIAPSPGVNWSGDAGKWFDNAGDNGWETTKDHKRATYGAIVVLGNHVQIVREIRNDGIVVQGMNEGWAASHEPLESEHKEHWYSGLKFYTGYVYQYFLTFNQVDSGYVFGDFKGYILPVRTDSKDSSNEDVLGVKSQEPFTYSEIGLESLSISSGLTQEQIIAKLGQPLKIDRYEGFYGSEEIELIYEGFSIGLSDGYFNGYRIFSSGIVGIRGLEVGDDVEKVLSSFLKLNDLPGVWKNPDATHWSDITSDCIELYFIDSDSEGLVRTGTYHCDEQSGEVKYISYSHYLPGSCGHSGVTFYIENGLITEIACGGF